MLIIIHGQINCSVAYTFAADHLRNRSTHTHKHMRKRERERERERERKQINTAR